MLLLAFARFCGSRDGALFSGIDLVRAGRDGPETAVRDDCSLTRAV